MLKNIIQVGVVSRVGPAFAPKYAKQSSRFKSDVQEETQLEAVRKSPKAILAQGFPEYYRDGKFASTRLSFVEFVDKALPHFKELGIHKDLEAYKELMKIFPPGRFADDSKFHFGIVHIPQQLSAIRILFEMDKNGVRPDKEMSRIVVAAFGKNSKVWLKICRANYWSMKGRHIDPNPLPEKLPEKTHELAKVVLDRMFDDSKLETVVRYTSELPDAIDKTWIAYSQSPSQRSIISKLDDNSMLYLENGGLTYAREKSLEYFVLKVKVDDETIKAKTKRPDLSMSVDYNNIKMAFYGRPVKEKMQELEDRYFVDDGYVLAVGITGTSSQDSVLSMLKFLQKNNPKLNNLNVVFRMYKQVPEVLNPLADPENDRHKQRESN